MINILTSKVKLILLDVGTCKWFKIPCFSKWFRISISFENWATNLWKLSNWPETLNSCPELSSHVTGISYFLYKYQTIINRHKIWSYCAIFSNFKSNTWSRDIRHKLMYLSRYSEHIIKIYGEIWSPYLIHLFCLKGSPRMPLTRTEALMVHNLIYPFP